jgi:hypothetical protein
MENKEGKWRKERAKEFALYASERSDLFPDVKKAMDVKSPITGKVIVFGTSGELENEVNRQYTEIEPELWLGRANKRKSGSTLSKAEYDYVKNPFANGIGVKEQITNAPKYEYGKLTLDRLDEILKELFDDKSTLVQLNI